MEPDCLNHVLSGTRIMIFGIPGSGKSTFALQISRLLHLPLFHLDKYFFKANWEERNYEEFLHIQRELVNKERWIIDGNATRSFEIRFQRADVVLYFRLNRFVCLWRLFKRLAFKDPQISDRAEGCSETVRFNLIRYLWGFNDRVKDSLRELRQKYPETPFYEITTDREIRFLLENARKAKEEKYTHRPYSPLFPSLFAKEKGRILSHIENILAIEHVGSTAIPGLGGKGIIDIALAVHPTAMQKVSLLLQKLGYEFRPSFSTPNRLYFITYRSDPEEGTRRYHIHLTYLGSPEWNDLVGFRDYLKEHPEIIREYNELKKEASQIANQDGKIYRSLKDPFFKKIEQLRNSSRS